MSNEVNERIKRLNNQRLKLNSVSIFDLLNLKVTTRTTLISEITTGHKYYRDFLATEIRKELDNSKSLAKPILVALNCLKIDGETVTMRMPALNTRGRSWPQAQGSMEDPSF